MYYGELENRELPFYVKQSNPVGSGKRCLDHESPVKFPYIHESRYLLESFHESRD